MFLFTINKKGTLLLTPDALKLCPELAILDERESRMIVLIYDYESPFNQKPEVDRINHAKNLVYGADVSLFNPNTEKWKAAVEAYKSLQYSPKREIMIKYEKQLIALGNKLEDDLTTRELSTILANEKMISARLKEINEDIVVEQEENNRRGGGELSFIQNLMKNNKDEWNRVKNKKPIHQ